MEFVAFCFIVGFFVNCISAFSALLSAPAPEAEPVSWRVLVMFGAASAILITTVYAYNVAY